VSEASTKSAHRGGLLWQSAAAVVAFAILCGLGTWQVQRLHWKTALIERVSAGLKAAPLPAPAPEAWPTLDFGKSEYQPVSVTGRFDNAHEIHVLYTLTEPKGPLGGLGYFVMTPLETAGGWIVYVNRGFVPAAKADPATRPDGQVEGETTVIGPLRQPGRRSWFMPADNAAKNQWFSRDPALFADAQGLPAAEVAPYIIDERFDPARPGGLPQGGETVVSFPNNHLGYLITWYGLAFSLALVYVPYLGKRLTQRRAERQTQA
jgi:surfeit locus 1 family protein